MKLIDDQFAGLHVWNDYRGVAFSVEIAIFRLYFCPSSFDDLFKFNKYFIGG
jgi:hypothetical protein